MSIDKEVSTDSSLRWFLELLLELLLEMIEGVPDGVEDNGAESCDLREREDNLFVIVKEFALLLLFDFGLEIIESVLRELFVSSFKIELSRDSLM